MAAPAIELTDLTKTFGSGRRTTYAVRGIDLVVPEGQVFGFLGANGAGKSTTIRMIADLIRPSSGQIRIFGESLIPGRGAVAVLRRVGVLVEGALFYPYLTARKNLEVIARTQGCYSAQQVEELLDLVDLAGADRQPVAEFSMGMKQRLGVASVLLGQPSLVILDEPTNGLDPEGILKMRAFLRQLVDERGLTVFLSSHLLSEVEQVCDRVAIINQGSLIRQGKVEELLGGEGILRIVATPLDRASSALSPHWTVEVSGDELLVDAPRELTPQVVRKLTEAEVDVFSVGRQRRTLEEYFLHATLSNAGESAVGTDRGAS